MTKKRTYSEICEAPKKRTYSEICEAPKSRMSNEIFEVPKKEEEPGRCHFSKNYGKLKIT